MKRPSFPFVILALLPLMACARQEAGEEAGATLESADVSMGMPVTTSSEEAKEHFMLGLRALDMGRPDDARPHFEQAIATDPAFAYGYLSLAEASNSLAEFKKNLELAVQNAAGASEAERLLIEIAQKGLEDDVQGQLSAAQRLVEIQPTSPRAWMALAAVQGGMGDESAARTTLVRATQAAPDFAPAYMMLGNSYLNEPRDLSKAQEAMAKAVELEPNESVPHDLLGDTYRAQGNLEMAAQEYTRTAELSPQTGDGYQQRGHVHSFLGDYDQARADYDAAIQIEKGKNAEASFRVYRALVSVHEGNARAAVDELNQLVGEIDGMGIPEPRGQKIFALFTLTEIALHSEMLPEAEKAIAQLNGLQAEQAQALGTEAARRNTRATAVILEGNLAMRKGDFATATAKANEFMRVMEPSADPEKNQPAHALLGMVALKQGKNDEAIQHFGQADPDDIYVTYQTALAMEGAGRAAEAKTLFQKVVGFNFNSPGLALVRKDAITKAG